MSNTHDKHRADYITKGWQVTDIERASPTAHTCFFCRQAGQPVEPVTLTLEATDLTPSWMPPTVQISTYRCTDRATCQALSLPQAIHAREMIQ